MPLASFSFRFESKDSSSVRVRPPSLDVFIRRRAAPEAATKADLRVGLSDSLRKFAIKVPGNHSRRRSTEGLTRSTVCVTVCVPDIRHIDFSAPISLGHWAAGVSSDYH